MTKQDKINLLAKAANNIRAAAESIREITEDHSDNHYLVPDAEGILKNLNEILESDGGEAGLLRLISISRRDVGKAL